MKNKILSTLTVLLGVMMINSGLNKFFNYMPMPELSPRMLTVVTALMVTRWIIPLVAVAEIIGGILIIFPKYRALGAVIVFPVMIGIVIHHLTHDIAGVFVGLVLFMINIWIIVENKDKYLTMVR